MGLGVVASGARRVTESMMLAAARALGANSPGLKDPAALPPPLTRDPESRRGNRGGWLHSRLKHRLKRIFLKIFSHVIASWRVLVSAWFRSVLTGHLH
jgi:hypothetical protein